MRVLSTLRPTSTSADHLVMMKNNKDQSARESHTHSIRADISVWHDSRRLTGVYVWRRVRGDVEVAPEVRVGNLK